ncbi:MAG TPA: polymer-forming cytoskeletal protein [Steroidobacteraceae bacterium]|jgi:cytoskeletal protein CcmA (bactofilin family)|nr:polymer-forming cytoskeletal protein [Steroidobacteraceae bacterium]
MTEPPKRRLLDRLGASPTFVAAGCRLTGDVETDGPMLLCGSIRGDGHVGGALSLTADAHWEGEVHASAAIIAGRFTGRLVIEGKLEIGASAVIHADIVARAVAIARGAVVDGDMTVTGGQPVVHFDEKRHHRHRHGKANL